MSSSLPLTCSFSRLLVYCQRPPGRSCCLTSAATASNAVLLSALTSGWESAPKATPTCYAMQTATANHLPLFTLASDMTRNDGRSGAPPLRGTCKKNSAHSTSHSAAAATLGSTTAVSVFDDIQLPARIVLLVPDVAISSAHALRYVRTDGFDVLADQMIVVALGQDFVDDLLIVEQPSLGVLIHLVHGAELLEQRLHVVQPLIDVLLFQLAGVFPAATGVQLLPPGCGDGFEGCLIVGPDGRPGFLCANHICQ